MTHKETDRSCFLDRPDNAPTHKVPDSYDSSTDAARAAAEAVSGWPERLAAMVAEREARKAAQRAFQADHERRRQKAHPLRHAAKLRRS